VRILEINLESGTRYNTEIIANNVKSAEKYAREMYESDGYNVSNLSPYRFTDKVPQNLIEAIESRIFPKKAYELSSPGLPDLVCWKKSDGQILELFFVEVKKNSDSLKMEQLIWFSKFNNLSSRIFCVYSEDSVNFDKGKHASPSEKILEMKKEKT